MDGMDSDAQFPLFLGFGFWVCFWWSSPRYTPLASFDLLDASTLWAKEGRKEGRKRRAFLTDGRIDGWSSAHGMDDLSCDCNVFFISHIPPNRQNCPPALRVVVRRSRNAVSRDAVPAQDSHLT